MNTSQYRAVATSTGIVHLPNQGVLAIAGRHRVRWLQGMITQDCKTLQAGASRYSCLTTAKGKVLADFQLYNDIDGQRFLLTLPAPNIGSIVEHLKRFIIVEDIEFSHLQKTVVTVQGPNAGDLLGVQSDLADVTVSGVTIRAARHDRTGMGGYDLWVEEAGVKKVMDGLSASGSVEVDEAILNAHRIENGLPLFGTDFDDSVIPQEACLDDALHWSKGCYIGQEVIARLHFRGHTNKELRQLSLHGSALPRPGANIFGYGAPEKSIGRITSATSSPKTGTVVALGYVRRKHFDPGAKLSVDVDGSLVDAVVTEQPIRGRLNESE